MLESKWTIHSSVTSISKNIYETRTDEWHTGWINPLVPFLRVDKNEIFTQMFLHFIKHKKRGKKILLS